MSLAAGSISVLRPVRCAQQRGRITIDTERNTSVPARPVTAPAFNAGVARLFRDYAGLLRLQDGNPFRINAYVRAAATIETLESDLRDVLHDEGVDGLTQLPTIGKGLASAIEEVARTGRFSQLERLRGASDPDSLFRSVPGIGAVLSRKIHDTLHIDTLEGLELAAHDGRLASIPGIGPRRVEAIKAALAGMLRRVRGASQARSPGPPARLLLDVDAEYRQKAAAQRLPKIAPRRFNAAGDAWLPVLHAARPPWHFTLLFSNTARAHELHKTADWVVAYYYDDDHLEGQCTIVTESRGELRGRRVIRGREAECVEAYAAGYRPAVADPDARGHA